MPTSRTRKPTGRPAWPLILVEGPEKSGKSFVTAQFAASPHVGRTFVWDLGDGTMDEYAELGPYEIVETNGTYTDLRDSVTEITALPPVDGKPNVYSIDCGTDLWDLLKKWTDHRARSSRSGIATLKDDPDAEIDASMNLWNDAKDRWSAIVNMLRRAPGIGVITAQAGLVTAVKDGRPVLANGKVQQTYTVNAEKTLTRSVTTWVRLEREPRRAVLVAARRLGLEIPAGGLVLPLENTLDHVVFEVLGAGTEFATPRAVEGRIGLTKGKAMQRVLAAVNRTWPALGEDEAKAEARRLWIASGIDRGTADQEFTDEDLVTALETVAAAAAQSPATVPAPAETGDQSPEQQGAQETDVPAESRQPEGYEPPAETPEQAAAREAHMQKQRDRIAAADVPRETLPDGLEGEHQTGENGPPDEPEPNGMPIAEVNALKGKPAVVAELLKRNLPTAGNLEVLKARLVAGVA